MNKKLTPWLPTIINAALTVLFTIYYSVFGDRLLSTYMQLLAGAFAPAIFPVLGLITKKHYSLSLSAITAIVCVLGIHLAKACNLYGIWGRYDLLLHTNFGLMGSAMIFALMLRWQGDKMHVAGQMIFVFLGVMGVGALWEILEFVCSWFTGEDPQRCWWIIDEAILSGKRGMNPVTDTMQDLTVTAIGSSVFMIGYFCDSLWNKGRIYKKLFGQPEFSDLAELKK